MNGRITADIREIWYSRSQERLHLLSFRETWSRIQWTWYPHKCKWTYNKDRHRWTGLVNLTAVLAAAGYLGHVQPAREEVARDLAFGVTYYFDQIPLKPHRESYYFDQIPLKSHQEGMQILCSVPWLETILAADHINA